MESWIIGVIGVFVGAVITGLIEFYRTDKNNKEIHKENIRTEKIKIIDNLSKIYKENSKSSTPSSKDILIN